MLKGVNCLVLILVFSAHAQKPLYQWVKQFAPISGFVGSGGSYYAGIVGIEQDNEDNLIVLGTYDFNTMVLDANSSDGVSGNSLADGTKAFVAKYTKNGVLLWQRTIEGLPSQFFSITQLSDLRVGTDGCIVFAGHFYGDIDFDPGVDEFVVSSASGPVGSKFVLKLSKEGDFEWVSLLNGDESHSLYSLFYLEINDIELDLDNNVYLTGPVSGKWDVNPALQDTFYIPDYHLGQDGYLLKLSSDGDLVWCKTFGTSEQNHPDNAHLIKRGLGNDLYFGCSYLDSIVINVAGQDTLLNHPPGISGSDLDYFMAKMDTSGQFEWFTRIVGDGGQWIREVEVDTNGELYACGSFVGSFTMYPFVAGTYYYSQYNNLLQQHFADGFLMKLTESGVPIWAKVVSSPYVDSFDEIEIEDEYVYFGGSTGDSLSIGSEFIGYLETLSISNYNHHRGTILQMSKDSEISWLQRFESNSSATLMDILVDENEIFSSGAFSYETDFDLSPEGYEYLNTELPFKTNGFLHKMVLSVDTFDVTQYAVYPNPFDDIVNLYAKDFENKTVSVFDIQGRLIREVELKTKITPINLNQQALGVYVLVIEDQEKSEIIRVVKG